MTLLLLEKTNCFLSPWWEKYLFGVWRCLQSSTALHPASVFAFTVQGLVSSHCISYCFFTFFYPMVMFFLSSSAPYFSLHASFFFCSFSFWYSPSLSLTLSHTLSPSTSPSLMFCLVQILLLILLATVFRCRCFITQPCFKWACAQKQCGWAWHRSLISCSQTKGWVMHASS